MVAILSISAVSRPRKTVAKLCFGGAAWLIAGILLAGCGSPESAQEPAVCDLTKLAYQSPTFVDQYFGHRPHLDYSGKFDRTHGFTRNFDYMGSKAAPGILVTFAHNRVVEVVVFFIQRQTLEQTARRVGLTLVGLSTVQRDQWKMVLTGTSGGVTFQSLTLTNITDQARDGSWNIIAEFGERRASSPYRAIGHPQT